MQANKLLCPFVYLGRTEGKYHYLPIECDEDGKKFRKVEAPPLTYSCKVPVNCLEVCDGSAQCGTVKPDCKKYCIETSSGGTFMLGKQYSAGVPVLGVNSEFLKPHYKITETDYKAWDLGGIDKCMLRVFKIEDTTCRLQPFYKNFEFVFKVAVPIGSEPVKGKVVQKSYGGYVYEIDANTEIPFPLEHPNFQNSDNEWCG